MKNIRKTIISKLFLILLSLLIVFVIITFFVRTYNVTSGSMEETLDVNDKLLANVFKAHFMKGERGDVVVFIPPYGENNAMADKPYISDSFFFINEKNKERYVKRIIGIPGDTIDIREGKVYVNDEAIEEDYLKPNTKTEKLSSNSVTYPFKLGKDEYFVMGDNRDNSKDSRVWGVLPAENIVAYPILIFYPFENWEVL